VLFITVPHSIRRKADSRSWSWSCLLASLLNLSQTLKIGPSVGYFTVRIALDSQDDRYWSRSSTALAMTMSTNQ